MQDGKGKNVLVVGGSSGIGAALVTRLLEKGLSVTVWSRNPPKNEVENTVVYETVDVTNSLDEQSPHVPETLHGIVYCPGTITLRPFGKLSVEQFEQDYDINVLGAVRVLQRCMPCLSPQGSSIVLFSTVAVRTGLAYHSSIAAAKSAVEGLVKSLAAEFASQNIRVNGVAPSLTDTPLAANLLSTDEKRQRAANRHAIKRVGTAEDMAAAADFLLSPDSSWITGQIISVDGGFSSVRILDS